METYQIIAGFSDVKSEFIKKTRTTKTLEELKLRFVYNDSVVYVLDFFDFKVGMVLAIFDSKIGFWKIYLRKNSYGYMTFQHLVNGVAVARSAEVLRDSYESNVFFSK